MNLFKKKDKIPSASGGYTTHSQANGGSSAGGFEPYRPTYTMPAAAVPAQSGGGAPPRAQPAPKKLGRKPPPSVDPTPPPAPVRSADDRLRQQIAKQQDPSFYDTPPIHSSSAQTSAPRNLPVQNTAMQSSAASTYSAAPPSYRENEYNSTYNRDGLDDEDESAEELDSDDEVEGIKNQIRYAKQEGLASTRNTIRMGYEAEETARAIVDKLGEQSERLLNTSRYVDQISATNLRALDEAREIEALNRSIFIPRFKRDTKAKRQKREAELLARHERERAAAQLNHRQLFETRKNINGTFKETDKDFAYEMDAEGNPVRVRRKLNGRVRANNPDRLKYQFEATQSDEEIEDELEANLDEIGAITRRLKTYAIATGVEVDAQNKRIEALGDNVDRVDVEVTRNTNRFARLK